MAKKKNHYRLTAFVNKQDYYKLKAILTERQITVSQWVRNEMEKVLKRHSNN